MSDSEEKIFDYIRWKLGVPPSSPLERPQALYGLSIDLMQVDSDEYFLVEVTSKSSIDSLARLNLARDIYVKEIGTKNKVTPVLVTQSISSTLYDKAIGLGIVIIEVPKGMLQDHSVSMVKRPIKITSAKSWQVVSKLFQLKSSTINRLSKEAAVSYGWTHATIEYLLRQNIAIRQGDLVHISDMEKLLSGIAWERSTMDLMTTEFSLGPGETFGLAKEISENLKKNEISCAFAAYLPGTLAIRRSSSATYWFVSYCWVHPAATP